MGSGSHFHLAQVNIARAKAPFDHPLLAGFNAQIEGVNALADASAGLVWRWKSEEALEPASGDPLLLFNLSVWESLDALREYVYRSGHTKPLARPKGWFHPPQGPHLALWWVPAGHIPAAAEAFARLDYLTRHAPGPASFTFQQAHDPPDSPPGVGEIGPIDYDGRIFHALSNTANGDMTSDVVFRYRQVEGRVWASYDGAAVRFGTLVAASGTDGGLDVRYAHVNSMGDWRTRRCATRPETLADGRLRLYETWGWTNGDRSKGNSVLEETVQLL